MIEVNFLGAFNMCKAIRTELQKSNHADIILLGDRADRFAFKVGVGYCTTKFEIKDFSEAQYLDAISDDIFVSLIAPVTVDTEFEKVKGQGWQQC